jgi:hypothetical protein
MATVAFVPNPISHGRISLAEIDAAVSARLGPTRIPGNSQPACFNRQIAMYLAKHLGRWSTTVIGRFYNGRDHSTVCYGIQRVEALRESDPDVDALITELKQQLSREHHEASNSEDFNKTLKSINGSKLSLDELAELVAERVCAYLERRMQHLS